MTEKFVALLAASAITVGVFTATSPAIAKDRPITVTATAADLPVRMVSYRDLNLASATGEKILVGRVRLAAHDVCVESAHGDPVLSAGITDCRSAARQRARPQIDRALARARQIAATGYSAIAPVAISITAR